MKEHLAALLRPELADLSAYAPADPPGIVARLDANEAPPPASPAIREAVRRGIERVAFERYPDARATRLKEQIARRTGAKTDELLVGSGSDEVIALLATALARPRSGPQAVVLTAVPTFVMYRVTARAHGLKPLEVPLDATWDLDVAMMTRAIDMMKPSLVYIASPNNPTGNQMSEDRIVRIVEAASGAFVILDEAYVDYAPKSFRSYREKYGHLGIMRTISKVGLAALRVGWLEADRDLVREIDKARQPYNVSATSQEAAATVLDEAWDDVRDHVAGIVRERERVADAIAKIPGYEVMPSAANFLWVKTPRPAGEVSDALVRRGVLVRSFHASGGRLVHQIRVTIGMVAHNDMLLEGLASCAG